MLGMNVAKIILGLQKKSMRLDLHVALYRLQKELECGIQPRVDEIERILAEIEIIVWNTEENIPPRKMWEVNIARNLIRLQNDNIHKITFDYTKIESILLVARKSYGLQPEYEKMFLRTVCGILKSDIASLQYTNKFNLKVTQSPNIPQETKTECVEEYEKISETLNMLEQVANKYDYI